MPTLLKLTALDYGRAANAIIVFAALLAIGRALIGRRTGNSAV